MLQRYSSYIQNRTHGSSSILSFIALQSSSKILKTRIRYTKNSKSKFSCKRSGMLPQNEVNPKFLSVDFWCSVEQPPKAKWWLFQEVKFEFAEVAEYPNFLFNINCPYPLKHLLSPPFVKTNCCAGLDNSPHVYFKRFHLISSRKSSSCAKNCSNSAHSHFRWLTGTFFG